MRGLEAENSVTEGQSQHVHLFPCSQDAGPVSLGHVLLGGCPRSHQPLRPHPGPLEALAFWRSAAPTPQLPLRFSSTPEKQHFINSRVDKT